MDDVDVSCHDLLKDKVKFDIDLKKPDVCMVHINNLRDDDVGEWQINLRLESDRSYDTTFNVTPHAIISLNVSNHMVPIIPVNRGVQLI